MKRLFLVVLLVATASACTGHKGTQRGSSLARQYDQHSMHDSERGDMDRAIGQR
jgi:hypothetical protein